MPYYTFPFPKSQSPNVHFLDISEPCFGPDGAQPYLNSYSKEILANKTRIEEKSLQTG